MFTYFCEDDKDMGRGSPEVGLTFDRSGKWKRGLEKPNTSILGVDGPGAWYFLYGK